MFLGFAALVILIVVLLGFSFLKSTKHTKNPSAAFYMTQIGGYLVIGWLAFKLLSDVMGEEAVAYLGALIVICTVVFLSIVSTALGYFSSHKVSP